MREFFNNIKTQIAIMDNLLFFALLALLSIVNLIKNMAKNDGKFKIQILPVIIFLLLLAVIILLCVCRFA